MIELSDITFRNFISYGDYETTIDLTNLGQCFITGHIEDDQGRESFGDSMPTKTRSNGAGKSNIPNAIMWALFGRTMHSKNPGGAVVNWFTGKECWARLRFKNGDIITRTRNTDGQNELLFVKDGDEQRLVSNTLATSTLQQAKLAKTFNLDWDVFCGSAFFAQYSKPWMEMADAVRKKAIERVLHVDKLTYYANSAKTRLTKLDELAQQARGKIETTDETISSLESQLPGLRESCATFDANRDARKATALRMSKERLAERDAITKPDAEKLKARWAIVAKIQERLDACNRQISDIEQQIRTRQTDITNATRSIDLWKQKAGKICTSCEQVVPKAHTADKITPFQATIDAAKQSIAQLQAKKQKLAATVAETSKIVAERKPELTLREAKEIERQWTNLDSEVKRYQRQAADIEKEQNPHTKAISDIEARLVTLRDSKKHQESEIERLNYVHKHYNYLYRSYHDREKIKSLALAEHIPMINARLKHYLDVFGLDVQIELTPSLGVTSNLWSYEFESGGERKRTDVAFMLAMYDLHEVMYGRQCNVIVLDEVDGRLDEDGIESLVEIIKNDLASKAESILIISHKEMMQDVFSRELRVTRSQRFSTVELI